MVLLSVTGCAIHQPDLQGHFRIISCRSYPSGGHPYIDKDKQQCILGSRVSPTVPQGPFSGPNPCVYRHCAVRCSVAKVNAPSTVAKCIHVYVKWCTMENIQVVGPWGPFCGQNGCCEHPEANPISKAISGSSPAVPTHLEDIHISLKMNNNAF